jgi:hypothetical protein
MDTGKYVANQNGELIPLDGQYNKMALIRSSFKGGNFLDLGPAIGHKTTFVAPAVLLGGDFLFRVRMACTRCPRENASSLLILNIASN